jgi:hypothetical protein
MRSPGERPPLAAFPVVGIMSRDMSLPQSRGPSMSAPFLLALLAVAPAAGPPAPAPGPARELLPPVRLQAAGKPIDTDVGHAAPCVADFDGDGVKDLLVGQFGDGVLWVYRNVGTDTNPKYAAGVKFKKGAADGRVPTG